MSQVVFLWTLHSFQMLLVSFSSIMSWIIPIMQVEKLIHNTKSIRVLDLLISERRQ